MVGFALAFRKYWKWIAAGLFVLSVAFAINLMIKEYNNAIVDREAAEQSAKEWEKKSDGWKASFEQSEILRQQETRQAISSADNERIVCNQRVASALQTRERINTITRVVPNENNTICPPAGLITSNELREAIGAR